ncbi:MAG: hypothetical protein J0M12_08405 [Deltaproteobacteria bacterium]|nr:hypothetical protein [Deltaproteobacteria bacterium]
MNSSLVTKCAYLPLGYRCEYRATLTSKEVYLPDFIDSTLRSLVECLVLKTSPIVNLKGRDQRNLIDPNIPATLLPSADEFCFIGGEITSSPKTPGQEFAVAVNSKFIANEKSHHMLHVCEIERRSFPADIKIEDIGRLPALHIKHFRLGFDIFESRFLSSLIGLIPTVSQTLLVEATEQSCEISISAEGLKKRQELPLQRHEIWDRLRNALLDTLHFDIEADYRSKLP